MKILIIDNYDSFTYNIVHVVKAFGLKPIVFRNDKIEIDAIDAYDKIILSPGPGIPNEAGLLKEIIKTYASKKPIFGVCLGLQAIAEVFGGSLINLKKVYHGVNSPIKIIEEDYIFEGIENNFLAGRYHSWVADAETLPEELVITAKDKNNEVMAIKHKTYDVRAVQFHPESILTEHGSLIIENFLKH